MTRLMTLTTFALVTTLTSPLDARAQTLTPQDYIAIQQLVSKYAYAIDECTNKGYDYADLYVPDGSFATSRNGKISNRFDGREKLAEAARGGAADCKDVPWVGIVHMLVNHVIEPAPGGGSGGNRATGKVYLIAIGLDGEPGKVEAQGRYEDVYVKTAQGWRFKSRLHVLAPGQAEVSRGSAQPRCDRACLRTALDQYLDGVVKHDPSAAPLFANFRQTENATVVRLGTGAWQTVTALGKVQRRFLDPVTGQAGYFGIVEEGANASVATLRLRVEDRKITEAEWIIARKDAWGPNAPGGGLVDPASLMANPPPDRTVPRDARSSREAMIAVANSYFDGLSTHDGSIILHEPGCSRIENGTVMTGRARGGQPPGDCTSGLEQINISLVAARRYPLVDEEAGVVLGMVVFMRKPGTATRRNLLTEWFFIDRNKIQTIYAAMFYPPPEAPVPNWPPYNGNWPLPAPAPAPAAPTPSR